MDIEKHRLWVKWTTSPSTPRPSLPGNLPMTRSLQILTLCCLFCASLSPVLQAADETFVGRLALAVEPEVAAEIGLKANKLSQLEQLVDLSLIHI